MTSLNVSLPESMRAWVDTQVKVGGYGTASEFIRELLREAKQNRAKRADKHRVDIAFMISPSTDTQIAEVTAAVERLARVEHRLCLGVLD